MQQREVCVCVCVSTSCMVRADHKDVLVRAIPTSPGVGRFIDNDWITFVNEFNARSRCIRRDAVAATSGELLRFIEVLVTTVVRDGPTASSNRTHSPCHCTPCGAA